MAGIGFELKRIVRQGTVASYLQVALSGAMIVAGPWLITIMAVGIIQRFHSHALSEGGDLFLSTVVYTYAGSLVIFGGLHYLFSRLLSDLLYEKKEGQTFSYLVWFTVLVGVLSAILGGGMGFTIRPVGIRFPLLYQWVTAAFFFLVSLHWLFVLYASLLRWYARIIIVYSAGMGIFVLSAALLSPRMGVAGVLGGFALGNAGILAGLAFLFFLFWKEVRVPKERVSLGEVLRTCGRTVKTYARVQWRLFLTGTLYYLALWIDKVLLWVSRGTNVEGTWFRLYPSFDTLVYYTNLTMIPGLVFFVVFTETGFATHLRRFLEGLSKRTYQSILKEKQRLIRESGRHLVDLALFQGCCVLTAVAFSSYWSPFPNQEMTILYLLGGVFFHLLFFVLLSFLFFLEAYPEALASTALFLVVNALTTLGAPYAPGAGYCAGAFFATLSAGWSFLGCLRRLEQRIFSRAAE